MITPTTEQGNGNGKILSASLPNTAPLSETAPVRMRKNSNNEKEPYDDLVMNGSEVIYSDDEEEVQYHLGAFPEFLFAFKKFYLGQAKKVTDKIYDLNERSKEKGIRNTVASINQGLQKRIIASQINFTEKLNEKLMKVPILKNKDKVTFLLGIALLMITEYILIAEPQWLWLLYLILLFPLMIHRFLTYHKMNHHYFMLDFCYYMQLWTLIVLFVFPQEKSLFKVYFGLCNGPLLTAVVAWRNKLVFHDLDKITSLFIHVFPGLLTYTIRWHTDLYNNNTEEDLRIWPNEIGYMILFYIVWQALYVLKTEYLDANKFQNDATLMSSARWLSSVQPHPIYRAIVNKGFKASPTQILVPIQLVYTICTLFPVLFMYQNKWIHLIVILSIFGVSAWGGASFYFESFTDNYTKRLEDKIKKFYEKKQDGNPNHKIQQSYLPKMKSVAGFLLFFSFGLLVLLGLLRLTVLWK